jgi:hypothetical protein
LVKFRVLRNVFDYQPGNIVYARTPDEIRLWDRREWAERVDDTIRTTTRDLPPENTTIQTGKPEGVSRARE